LLYEQPSALVCTPRLHQNVRSSLNQAKLSRPETKAAVTAASWMANKIQKIYFCK
jgi:hypothetical protein